MTPDRGDRIAELFQQALEIPPGKRDAFLRRMCGDDDDLYRELVELVKNDVGDVSLAPPPGRSDISTGARIGPYILQEKLGEGGFGEVFAAEQTAPVRRRVAVKILKPGLDTRAILNRFEAERQTLALMDHPSVARVHDAGETDRGHPYFVMELIDGVPITKYCDRNGLSIEDRLDLFVRACEAIQHAHNKGVIHRDIKPSNILVTEVDGRPLPKVIDFGIAKASGRALREGPGLTPAGLLLGTPEYMSPEQADLGGGSVEVFSDVYSLGVLLYELLTGSLPFETSGTFEETCRVLREQTPPKPSTRVDGRRSKTLQRELDWITMRALEKVPSRRYQSPAALAEDIERYRRGDAILAGPPSRAYQARKFVGRHKLSVAFGATLLVLLIAFGVSMGVLRQNAESARDEAEARAAELELVTAFQSSMLQDIDLQAMGASLVSDFVTGLRSSLADEGLDSTAAETVLVEFDSQLRRTDLADEAQNLVEAHVLARAATAIDRDFDDRPLIRASLQQGLAETYTKIGRWEGALPLQQEALATRREILGDRDPRTLTAIAKMSAVMELASKFDEAIVFCREALEGRRAVLGNRHRDTIESVGRMGLLLHNKGDREGAMVYMKEAVETSRAALGEKDPQTLSSIHNMGGLLYDLGRDEEAMSCFREALDGRTEVLGADDLETLATLNQMAVLLMRQGRMDEAGACYQEALDASVRAYGRRHPQTLTSANNMASFLYSQGRLSEAKTQFQDAFEISRAYLGARHFQTLMIKHNVGVMMGSLGEFDSAKVCLEECVDTSSRVMGPKHEWTVNFTRNLARILIKKGEFRGARDVMTKSLAAAREVFWSPEEMGTYLMVLGQAQTGTSDFLEAESSLLEAHRLLDGEAPQTQSWRQTVEALDSLYGKWNAAEPGLHERDAKDWHARALSLASPEDANPTP